jgi:serine/threonine protein phosphatase 1
MIAVIGDIHGCFFTLEKLYNEIISNYPGIPICSVGDLVDRGKNNYEVVDFIKRNRITFTAGNHDLMFYYFIKHPSSPLGTSWIYNGSETTLDSYSNRYKEMNLHLNFIIKAPLILNLDDCFISHAGISGYYSRKLGKKPLDDMKKLKSLVESELNTEHGILWTRDKLMNLGKLQIVGHTRVDELYFDKKSNALYVDTSAYAGNKLSAAIIDKSNVVETLSIGTDQRDI